MVEEFSRENEDFDSEDDWLIAGPKAIGGRKVDEHLEPKSETASQTEDDEQGNFLLLCIRFFFFFWLLCCCRTGMICVINENGSWAFGKCNFLSSVLFFLLVVCVNA